MRTILSFFLMALISCQFLAAQDLLVSNGSSWSYYDAGNSPDDIDGNSWIDINYNDSSWSIGTAQLGYGDGDENTTLNSDAETVYFRHLFNIADASSYTDFDIDLTYDDGVIVYLNGIEIWRINMLNGIVDYNTTAASASSENAFANSNFLSNLVTGDNLISVELHQASTTSSDISFDLNLTANFPIGNMTILTFGDNWNYYDNENSPSNQGNLTWQDNNFDDNSWNSGNAELGYGDNDEATVINFSAITSYFRKSFNITNSAQYSALSLDLIYDDGAVVYINGAEVWRVNMPDGAINYNTFSSNQSNENELASTIIANNLVVGLNNIAVEVHQTSAISSDLSFDLKFGGIVPGQINLERGPYLQTGTPTSVRVKWRTNSPTESIINFGTSLGNLNQSISDLAPKADHELVLTGLSPNTTYFYSIANSSLLLVDESIDLYFKTSPQVGSNQPIIAWILGDCGTADNNQRLVRDAYYNYIGSNHTDMILFLGDNAYTNGTDNEYKFSIFENMYEDKLKNTISYSCLGNHDGYSANSDSQTGPYYDIFSLPSNGEGGGIPSGTEAYYSYDYGNIHFIVLDSYDSDNTVGGAMHNWCLSDIQNTSQEWIVAFWHHPPYTKGSHDSDLEPQLIDMRENFLPMLESNGVDLVLSGHSHSYERSFFLNNHYGNSGTFSSNIHTVGLTGDGDGRIDGNGAYIKDKTGTLSDDGAVYITAGSSGKTSGVSQHNAMYTWLDELGSVILEVDSSTMNVKFINSAGSISDYFTIEKEDPDCGGVDVPCDDGDECTSNDLYDEICNCIGTFQDADNDGVCDANDQCPGFDDALFGIEIEVVNLGSNLIATSNGDVYQWLDCSNNYSSIIGATNSTFSPTQSGFYAVKVNNEVGCTDTSDCYQVVLLNNIESVLDNEITLFPNPFTDGVNISFKNVVPSISILVENEFGHLIKHLTFSNTDNLSIPINAASGMYIITISSDSWSKSMKIIKN